ncbi:REP-associated tyrosine transposase [Stutzerimonas nitrititolerans]|uniref:REP-associated tyrosine transposase n=1 Tax=Stutzerimonas nitrititolerans TaxID=2482751 RepID=UPI0028976663|nr:transposase [Stutzerimonas nitrititolerans]
MKKLQTVAAIATTLGAIAAGISLFKTGGQSTSAPNSPNISGNGNTVNYNGLLLQGIEENKPDISLEQYKALKTGMTYEEVLAVIKIPGTESASSGPVKTYTWGTPDHMHCVWTLPDGDADFALRWKVIKFAFARRLPKTEVLTATQRSRGERGIWQRRYWEHLIQDERDYRHHVDYVHLNPLKHGLVERVADWPYSSFHRAVRVGIYPASWCGGEARRDS